MSTKKKILIVDDDQIVVRLAREILRAEGFTVEIARDGLRGLEKIKQNKYDAIISNMDMPRMKGDQLYLEVKKLDPGLAMKIIFISGNINAFIKSTGNRYIAKPFSHKQLVKALKDTITPSR